MTHHPVQPFLEAPGYLVLDGGLASELEHDGFDLADRLWSARLLLEAPEAIAAVHRRYLEAGADCITSASYQATIEGIVASGATESAAVEAIGRSVTLAIQARDEFWSNPGRRKNRRKPLVAAGVGPYGAYLADGSEFTGDYGLDEAQLVDFHRRRWEILNATDADLFACETIPSLHEARALAKLLTASPSRYAWFSFSCRDGEHISDGTPMATCVRELAGTPRLVAIGVNCTAPRHIPALIGTIRRETDLPIVVYPNSGESWDADSKSWSGPSDSTAFSASGRGWYEAGARLIGGCCRTRPQDIRRLREILGS